MAELVHTVKKDERVALLRQELSKLTFPAKFQLALDPRFECSGLKVEKCKCMDSKKVPLWLVFKNADPLGDSLVVIFKCGRRPAPGRADAADHTDHGAQVGARGAPT